MNGRDPGRAMRDGRCLAGAACRRMVRGAGIVGGVAGRVADPDNDRIGRSTEAGPERLARQMKSCAARLAIY